jgi:hypothetical protein
VTTSLAPSPAASSTRPRSRTISIAASRWSRRSRTVSIADFAKALENGNPGTRITRITRIQRGWLDGRRVRATQVARRPRPACGPRRARFDLPEPPVFGSHIRVICVPSSDPRDLRPVFIRVIRVPSSDSRDPRSVPNGRSQVSEFPTCIGLKADTTGQSGASPISRASAPHTAERARPRRRPSS